MRHYAKEPIEVSVDGIKLFHRHTVGGGPWLPMSEGGFCNTGQEHALRTDLAFQSSVATSQDPPRFPFSCEINLPVLQLDAADITSTLIIIFVSSI
jgi:hypothetical protein